MIDLNKFRDKSKDFTILYVEDEQLLQDKIKIYLQKFFSVVDTALNGEEALNKYNKNSYDIILTDINMPIMNGIEMSKIIREKNQHQTIIIISAYTDTNYFMDSIKIGIDGYILKPIDFKQLNITLYKAVDKLQNQKQNLQYKQNLEESVKKRTLEVQTLLYEKMDTYKQILYTLVNIIEERDTYTGGHSQRVAKYSYIIAKELGFDEKSCENIYQAGILHDIGKVIIPDIILLKPSKLDDNEYKIIQEHVNLGVELISKIPALNKLSKFISQHHERLDGSGYPNQLKGDEIYIESQILGLCDMFDAMTTSRIYKVNKNIEDVLDEIKQLSGIHFEKRVVDAAIKKFTGMKIDTSINQIPKTLLEKQRVKYFKNININ